MAKNIFQKFASALPALDNIFNFYVAKSDGTEGRAPLSLLANIVNLSPFDVKVTSFSELLTALAAGKVCINIAANITFTQNISLDRSVTLYIASGVTVDGTGYSIDQNGNNFLTLSFADLSSQIIYAFSSPNNFIVNTGGASVCCLVGNPTIDNQSTSDNTFFNDTNTLLQADSITMNVPGYANAGINIQGALSQIKGILSLFVVAASSEALVISINARVASAVVFNIANCTNNLVTVNDQSILGSLVPVSNDINITSAGGTILSSVYGNDAEIANLTVHGGDKISQCSIGLLTSDGPASNIVNAFIDNNINLAASSNNCSIVGSHGSAGSFTNSGTNNRFVANSGTITNNITLEEFVEESTVSVSSENPKSLGSNLMQRYLQTIGKRGDHEI